MRSLLFVPALMVFIHPWSFFQPRVSSLLLESIGAIVAPVSGQILQGNIVIRGSTIVDGFQSYEVDFSYSSDANHTWFLIQESAFPVQDGILALWDTTRITDGNYTLRLLVTTSDSNRMEFIVENLTVRNDSAVATQSPVPSLPQSIPATTLVGATSSPFPSSVPLSIFSPPTLTPLPVNPASVSPSAMVATLGTGAAFSIAIFIILGGYFGYRSIRDRRK